MSPHWVLYYSSAPSPAPHSYWFVVFFQNWLEHWPLKRNAPALLPVWSTPQMAETLAITGPFFTVTCPLNYPEQSSRLLKCIQQSSKCFSNKLFENGKCEFLHPENRAPLLSMGMSDYCSYIMAQLQYRTKPQGQRWHFVFYFFGRGPLSCNPY